MSAEPTPHDGHEHAELDLDRFLPYRLSVLSNRISQAIAKLAIGPARLMNMSCHALPRR